MDQLGIPEGQILHNRYEITRQLARGGMGAVYEATDLHEKQLVAIKQMLPLDPDLRIAFKREASIVSKLSHPGIARATDYFETPTGLFIVMDFVHGPNLAQLITTRGVPFAPHQVKQWAEDLLQTLNFIHTQQPRIIHRDIKPSNLKLNPHGRLVLLDFGLAKEIAHTEDLITKMSILAYTPHYAPLEQIQGEHTDCYSDIYALGATLYHLLTGTPPADALKRANHLLLKKPDPLHPINHLTRGVPHALSSIIMKALSLAPSDRPSSSMEMLQQLKAGVITPSFKTNRTNVPRQQKIPVILEATNDSPLTTLRPLASPRISRSLTALPVGDNHLSLVKPEHLETPSRPQTKIHITFPAPPVRQSIAPPPTALKLHGYNSSATQNTADMDIPTTHLPHPYKRFTAALLLASLILLCASLYKPELNPFRQLSRPNSFYSQTEISPAQMRPPVFNTDRSSAAPKNESIPHKESRWPQPLTMDDFARRPSGTNIFNSHRPPAKRLKQRRRRTQPTRHLPRY